MEEFTEKELLKIVMSRIHSIGHDVAGMTATIDSVCDYIGLPRKCIAPDRVTPLKIGDVLYCRDGDIKTVLEIGWKWAVLSQAVSQGAVDKKVIDGRWYEDEMRQHGFSLVEGGGKDEHD